MDGGEVLQGLEEQWTFMGANFMEWVCGIVVFLMIGSISSSTVQAMPFMLAGLALTSTTLASLRRMFPDEHRGVRNMLTSGLGLPPIDIPAPSSLQPIWSGSPVRELPVKSPFVRLGLHEMFPTNVEDLKDADGREEDASGL
ncbi:MAG: hypothetical protein IT290_03085 [Deltaproteobacteria bacterium]|nr:hypothetical protein [Deltaproteobacteria bacterium]